MLWIMCMNAVHWCWMQETDELWDAVVVLSQPRTQPCIFDKVSQGTSQPCFSLAAALANFRFPLGNRVCGTKRGIQGSWPSNLLLAAADWLQADCRLLTAEWKQFANLWATHSGVFGARPGLLRLCCPWNNSWVSNQVCRLWLHLNWCQYNKPFV